jgi:hypothetical protein
VPIGRQRILDSEVAHNVEAEAVGEGPLLIGMLQEESPCLGKAIGIDPLDSARCGTKNDLEAGFNQMP